MGLQTVQDMMVGVDSPRSLSRWIGASCAALLLTACTATSGVPAASLTLPPTPTLPLSPTAAPTPTASPQPTVQAYATKNLSATADLRSTVVPGPNLPTAWRIVEPAPLDELLRYYREAEAEFGVHWSYLASIHLVETRMGRIRGVSTAGAQGPMQFMPGTWAAYGEGDINSNRDAIRA